MDAAEYEQLMQLIHNRQAGLADNGDFSEIAGRDYDYPILEDLITDDDADNDTVINEYEDSDSYDDKDDDFEEGEEE